MQMVRAWIAPAAAGGAWLAGELLRRAEPGSPRPPNPDSDPIPGGNLPTQFPPVPPDELPDIGPTGPRMPAGINEPSLGEPVAPATEPEYVPGGPTGPKQV